MSALGGAVETAPVSSLHAFGSVNPDDFPVPTGREEEWRFTPLRRLRGLHKDAVLGSEGVTVAVDAAPEIELSERTRPSADSSFLPADRISARAFAAAATATVITVPKEAVASRPDVRDRHRNRRQRRDRRAPRSSTCSRTGGLPWSSTSGVSATYADNVEIHVADGGDLTVVVPRRLGRRRGAGRAPCSHARPRRAPARTSRSRSAARWSGCRRRSATRAPAATPSCTASLSPTPAQHLEHRLFVDHDTPNCRSRVRYKGALRGDGAHTVWIGDVLIRPGGHRHGHLRVQQEPGAHRRGARRLGAEPGDPHRRGGRRRARQRQRPARGRAPVLPPGPRHPVRGGAPPGHPRASSPS